MDKFKIYRKDNYIVITNNLTQETYYGFVKEAMVDKSNANKAAYRIFNVKDFNDKTGLVIDQILKEDGSLYTQEDFETFYTQNTGNFNGGGTAPGIPEAPIDGNQYGRQDGNWTEITGGGGSQDLDQTLANGDTALDKKITLNSSSTGNPKNELSSIQVKLISDDFGQGSVQAGGVIFTDNSGNSIALNSSSGSEIQHIGGINSITALTFNHLDNSNSVQTFQAKSGIIVLSSDLDSKADLVGGLVPQSQLPSYVDDVVEVANFAALPITGEIGKIYITLDNNKQFRWSGSAYIQITNGLIATTNDLPEGISNLYFTTSRVLSTLLTGLSLVTGGAITASDSILIAFGKIQKNITDILSQISGASIPQITITTSTNIFTSTNDVNGYGQKGRSVILDNGANEINLTVDASDGFSASYLKHGTGTINFVNGVGRNLITVYGSPILNGGVGSTATISSVGTTDYLRISNI